MKFSSNGENEGVRLGADGRRPTLKEIREQWEPCGRNPSEQSTPINWGVARFISDILSYLEGLESPVPRYVPEPRLGPQPESEEETIEREKWIAEMAEIAEAKLAVIKAITGEQEEPKVCTTNGEPVEKVRAEQIQETGQYKSYVVLCPDERAKGFVRPYRDSYKHVTCGTVTTMGNALSETYARDPKFYGATFCAGCNKHLPLSEFRWTADGETLGT